MCFENLNVIKYLEQTHLLLFILDNLFLYYQLDIEEKHREEQKLSQSVWPIHLGKGGGYQLR